MNALTDILVIADPRMRHTPALERAAELAQRAGARVHLQLFDNPLPADPLADGAERASQLRSFVKERTQWLSQQAATLADRGIKTDHEFVPTASPHRAILAKVLQYRPSLVVKDIHDRPQEEWLAFTPEEEQLLEHCPAPVMLVRPSSGKLPHRILVAVDTAVATELADLFNETIVEQALGRAAEAEVHLAQVFAHKPLTGDPNLMARDHEAARREAAHGYFERFAQRFGFAPDRYHWIEGKPAEALADLATSLGAGCLVIGNVHHSLWARLYLEVVGSKTERLVTRTACDVILVKAHTCEAELGRRVDLDAVCREYGVNWRHAA